MSDLLRRAGEIRGADEELQRQRAANEAAEQADLERRRDVAEQRIGEFVKIMLDAKVPTVSIYIEEKSTPPGYDPRSGKTISHMGYTYLGEGWLATEGNNDAWGNESLEPGTFVCTDGRVYGCQEVSQKPPIGAPERYTRAWPEGDYTLVHYPHEHGEDYPYENGARPTAFSGEDGYEVLAQALVRHGVVG